VPLVQAKRLINVTRIQVACTKVGFKKGAACSVRDGMHGRTMDLKGVIPAPWGQSLPIVVHRCLIIWLTFLLFFYRLFGGF
jgi:hypothetical protein